MRLVSNLVSPWSKDWAREEKAVLLGPLSKGIEPAQERTRTMKGYIRKRGKDQLAKMASAKYEYDPAMMATKILLR